MVSKLLTVCSRVLRRSRRLRLTSSSAFNEVETAPRVRVGSVPPNMLAFEAHNHLLSAAMVIFDGDCSGNYKPFETRRLEHLLLNKASDPASSGLHNCDSLGSDRYPRYRSGAHASQTLP